MLEKPLLGILLPGVRHKKQIYWAAESKYVRSNVLGFTHQYCSDNCNLPHETGVKMTEMKIK